MPVRDQDDVRFRLRALERHGAAEVRHPVAQQRIGQQPDAVQVEEHGCMTDVANDQ
jgi:hypothetical protein